MGGICDECEGPSIKTDLDLPEAYRTQANLWKAKYFEACKELSKANKGIRRLRKQKAELLRVNADNMKHFGREIRDHETLADYSL